jgi:membrane protein DedA with SNARE-associated domain
MITEVFSQLVEWYMGHINYFTITLLMAIESSFIPFPSEIIIPPAAYKAAMGELNIYLVIFFGTFGALIGALFNYFLALLIGRKVIYALANLKIVNLLMINQHSVEKSEEYFRKYGNMSTFIGRLVPAVRQLISIPAGLSKMNLKSFILYTTLGAGIWNIILALLGYFFYTQKELLEKYYHELTITFLIAGFLFVCYILLKVFVFNKKEKNITNGL